MAENLATMRDRLQSKPQRPRKHCSVLERRSWNTESGQTESQRSDSYLHVRETPVPSTAPALKSELYPAERKQVRDNISWIRALTCLVELCGKLSNSVVRGFQENVQYYVLIDKRGCSPGDLPHEGEANSSVKILYNIFEEDMLYIRSSHLDKIAI